MAMRLESMLVYKVRSPKKRDLPSSACSSNHVKVLARLWWRVRIDGFHDSLQDVEGREATDASAVKAEEVEFPFCDCHGLIL